MHVCDRGKQRVRYEKPTSPIRGRYRLPLYGIAHSHVCARCVRRYAETLDRLSPGAGDRIRILADRNFDLELQNAALKADNLWLRGRVSCLSKNRRLG